MVTSYINKVYILFYIHIISKFKYTYFGPILCWVIYGQNVQGNVWAIKRQIQILNLRFEVLSLTPFSFLFLFIIKLYVYVCIYTSLQETGVLPTHKNVGKNEKYVGKRYVDVFHGVGRTESGEAFPTPYLHSVGNSGVENASSPTFFVCRDTLLRHLLCILVPTFYCVGNSFLYIF